MEDVTNSDNPATGDTTPDVPQDGATVPVDVTPAPMPETTLRTLEDRAKAIIAGLEGLSFHDAITVLHHVAEAISGGATREAAIVKTKFEEAILWVQRHFTIKAVAAASEPDASVATDAG